MFLYFTLYKFNLQMKPIQRNKNKANKIKKGKFLKENTEDYKSNF